MFMKERYMIEDIMFLCTHDFLSSVAEHSGSDKVCIYMTEYMTKFTHCPEHLGPFKPHSPNHTSFMSIFPLVHKM